MEEYAGTSLARWHFHDLRRTFRSNARRLGIDRETAELMLNHKRKGIEDIYNKSQELELRAAGFAAWESFLTRIAVESGAADSLLLPVSDDWTLRLTARCRLAAPTAASKPPTIAIAI